AEVFSGVEAERSRGSERADGAVCGCCEMRLAAVFDERESVALCERSERRRVCGLAVQMHRQERGRTIGNRTLRRAWVERQSLRIDIGEDWTGAHHDDRDGGVRGRQWSRDDLVAGADAQC